MIEVKLESIDPDSTAQIANAVTDGFIAEVARFVKIWWRPKRLQASEWCLTGREGARRYLAMELLQDRYFRMRPILANTVQRRFMPPAA